MNIIPLNLVCDLVKEDDLKRWIADFKKTLKTSNSSFGMLIDMRKLSPLTQKKY